jgi:hypothetical protein
MPDRSSISSISMIHAVVKWLSLLLETRRLQQMGQCVGLAFTANRLHPSGGKGFSRRATDC